MSQPAPEVLNMQEFKSPQTSGLQLHKGWSLQSAAGVGVGMNPSSGSVDVQVTIINMDYDL